MTNLITTPRLNPPCATCGGTKRQYELRLVSSGRSMPFPKYIPQIKETCDGCGRFIKFSKQTPELIAVFNSMIISVNDDLLEGKNG